MALSIGVSVGSRITVGGHVLHVKATRPNEMIVRVDGSRDVVVNAETRAEILPDLYVFVATGPKPDARRLSFDAPNVIRIERIEPPAM